MRVGIGIDFHRLVGDRPLVLGGVEIPFGKGLLGHSDADVLVHAIADALLGAAGLGDIGQHFPDTDERYKGTSSLRLLDQISQMLRERRLAIGNIDATVIAERPRLAPHIQAMTRSLCQTLQLKPGQLNLKATTSEGMGFAGRGEGMGAWAVALLNEASK